MTNNLNSKQKIYVQNRVCGKNKKQSLSLAGYSPYTKAIDVEPRGGKVENIIKYELEKIGLGAQFLAHEIKWGVRESKKLKPLYGPQGQEHWMPDLSHHIKYVDQVARLSGYANQGPAVAIQINNNQSGSEGVDASRVEDLVRRVEEEIKFRESSDVYEGSIEPGDSSSHSGMVSTDQ